jgi:hypothetical protein
MRVAIAFIFVLIVLLRLDHLSLRKRVLAVENALRKGNRT